MAVAGRDQGLGGVQEGVRSRGRSQLQPRGDHVPVVDGVEPYQARRRGGQEVSVAGVRRELRAGVPQPGCHVQEGRRGRAQGRGQVRGVPQAHERPDRHGRWHVVHQDHVSSSRGQQAVGRQTRRQIGAYLTASHDW